MNDPWTGEFARALALFAIALGGGWLFGEPGLALAAAMGFYILWQARQARRFLQFTKQPLRRPEGLSGIWEEAAFRHHHAARRGRNRMRRIIGVTRRFLNSTEALPDAAVVIDTHGDINWFNSTAGRLLALKRADLGRNIGTLLRHPQILRLLEGEVPGNVAEVQSLRNEDAVLEVRIVSFGDDDRLLLARDITQVQRLLTMRQDFVANVSHELRTPLTVIVGYLEALGDLDEPDAATVAKLLGRLEAPTLRMRSLVEELLLLSRLDTSGNPAIEDMDPVDLGSVLRGILSEAEDMCSERHRLELVCPAGVKVLGIERELHSAFMNLVVNAIRYSPDGGRIRLTWIALPEGGARLDVSDEGLGIAEEHIARLTERFYRVDVGRSREQGGTGLGLAIVKHVLRRHRGTLSVTSELGRGSTFSCTLPARMVLSAGNAAGAPEAPKPSETSSDADDPRSASA